MFEYLELAIDSAVNSGAKYSDARILISKSRNIAAKNGEVENYNESEKIGIGIRALVGSSWGFYSTYDLSKPSLTNAGIRAFQIAKASSMVSGDDLPFADVPVVEDSYTTPHDQNPFSISSTDQVDLLLRSTEQMKKLGSSRASGRLDFWDTEKWFASSQGHKIYQNIIESGGGISSLAVGDGETQIRSYPQSFGEYRTGGWEVIKSFEFENHTERLAEESQRLLVAPQCPEGTMDLILEGSQLALQIHESVGHAIELDRILGWEAAYAGTSHLDLTKLNQHKYGSELMNIVADATLPGALATFKYDDEGTPAQRVDIVKEGIWTGVLSGRDSAAVAGVKPGGMVRADGFGRLPMVRMTNVGLLPGTSSLEEIIQSTEDGVYMETNRSWSIDDLRLNFQFGCEVGWLVKNGKIIDMVKNPTYTGITPQFWGNMDMLAGEEEWVFWGTPNCGKGQPSQVGHTGHPASPARFKDTRIGVRG